MNPQILLADGLAAVRGNELRAEAARLRARRHARQRRRAMRGAPEPGEISSASRA